MLPEDIGAYPEWRGMVNYVDDDENVYLVPGVREGQVVGVLLPESTLIGRIDSIEYMRDEPNSVKRININNYGSARGGMSLRRAYMSVRPDACLHIPGSEVFCPDWNTALDAVIPFRRFMNRLGREWYGDDMMDTMLDSMLQPWVSNSIFRRDYRVAWWFQGMALQDEPRDGVLAPTSPTGYDSVRIPLSWRDFVYALAVAGVVQPYDEIAMYEMILRLIDNKPQKSRPWQLGIVSGKDIQRIYLEEHFGSCMHTAPTPEFFAKNPERVAMLTLRNHHGYLKARALLWYTDQGTVFMDRIYPVNDHDLHTQMLKAVAKEMGWDSRRWQQHRHNPDNMLTTESGDVGYSVTLRNHALSGYPFLDSMIYALGMTYRDVKSMFTTLETIQLMFSEPERDPYVTLRHIQGGVCIEGFNANRTVVRNSLEAQGLSYETNRHIWQDEEAPKSLFIYPPYERIGVASEVMEWTPTFAQPFPDSTPQEELPELLKQYVLLTGEGEMEVPDNTPVVNEAALDDVFASLGIGAPPMQEPEQPPQNANIYYNTDPNGPAFVDGSRVELSIDPLTGERRMTITRTAPSVGDFVADPYTDPQTGERTMYLRMPEPPRQSAAHRRLREVNDRLLERQAAQELAQRNRTAREQEIRTHYFTALHLNDTGPWGLAISDVAEQTEEEYRQNMAAQEAERVEALRYAADYESWLDGYATELEEEDDTE
jgi:hypothetical protein